MTSAASVWSSPLPGMSSSRGFPPRRPRRRLGSSAATASHLASMSAVLARMAASSAHWSGLSRCAASSSRSRSSGVRERRAIRWLRSANRARSTAAAAAPRVWPSSDSSTSSIGGGAAGAAPSRSRPAGRSRRPCDRCRGPRSRGSGRAGGMGSRSRPTQSNEISGWVCSSASRTSASSDLRPICTLGGDRKRYSTRARPEPCPARYPCIT